MTNINKESQMINRHTPVPYLPRHKNMMAKDAEVICNRHPDIVTSVHCDLFENVITVYVINMNETVVGTAFPGQFADKDPSINWEDAREIKVIKVQASWWAILCKRVMNRRPVTTFSHRPVHATLY